MSAFILMEVIFAILFFGFAALSLTRALSSVAQLANASKMDIRMIQRLQSTLTLYSKMSRVEETKQPITSPPDELGVVTETVITELRDQFENEDGQKLQQMFLIRVTAYFENDGGKGTMSSETLRYAPLYRTTAGG